MIAFRYILDNVTEINNMEVKMYIYYGRRLSLFDGNYLVVLASFSHYVVLACCFR